MVVRDDELEGAAGVVDALAAAAAQLAPLVLEAAAPALVASNNKSLTASVALRRASVAASQQHQRPPAAAGLVVSSDRGNDPAEGRVAGLGASALRALRHAIETAPREHLRELLSFHSSSGGLLADEGGPASLQKSIWTVLAALVVGSFVSHPAITTPEVVDGGDDNDNNDDRVRVSTDAHRTRDALLIEVLALCGAMQKRRPGFLFEVELDASTGGAGLTPARVLCCALYSPLLPIKVQTLLLLRQLAESAELRDEDTAFIDGIQFAGSLNGFLVQDQRFLVVTDLLLTGSEENVALSRRRVAEGVGPSGLLATIGMGVAGVPDKTLDLRGSTIVSCVSFVNSMLLCMSDDRRRYEVRGELLANGFMARLSELLGHGAKGGSVGGGHAPLSPIVDPSVRSELKREVGHFRQSMNDDASSHSSMGGMSASLGESLGMGGTLGSSLSASLGSPSLLAGTSYSFAYAPKLASSLAKSGGYHLTPSSPSLTVSQAIPVIPEEDASVSLAVPQSSVIILNNSFVDGAGPMVVQFAAYPTDTGASSLKRALSEFDLELPSALTQAGFSDMFGLFVSETACLDALDRLEEEGGDEALLLEFEEGDGDLFSGWIESSTRILDLKLPPKTMIELRMKPFVVPVTSDLPPEMWAEPEERTVEIKLYPDTSGSAACIDAIAAFRKFLRPGIDDSWLALSLVSPGEKSRILSSKHLIHELNIHTGCRTEVAELELRLVLQPRSFQFLRDGVLVGMSQIAPFTTPHALLESFGDPYLNAADFALAVADPECHDEEACVSEEAAQLTIHSKRASHMHWLESDVPLILQPLPLGSAFEVIRALRRFDIILPDGRGIIVRVSGGVAASEVVSVLCGKFDFADGNYSLWIEKGKREVRRSRFLAQLTVDKLYVAPQTPDRGEEDNDEDGVSVGDSDKLIFSEQDSSQLEGATLSGLVRHLFDSSRPSVDWDNPRRLQSPFTEKEWRRELAEALTHSFSLYWHALDVFVSLVKEFSAADGQKRGEVAKFLLCWQRLVRSGRIGAVEIEVPELDFIYAVARGGKALETPRHLFGSGRLEHLVLAAVSHLSETEFEKSLAECCLGLTALIPNLRSKRERALLKDLQQCVVTFSKGVSPVSPHIRRSPRAAREEKLKDLEAERLVVKSRCEARGSKRRQLARAVSSVSFRSSSGKVPQRSKSDLGEPGTIDWNKFFEVYGDDVADVWLQRAFDTYYSIRNIEVLRYKDGHAVQPYSASLMAYLHFCQWTEAVLLTLLVFTEERRRGTLIAHFVKMANRFLEHNWLDLGFNILIITSSLDDLFKKMRVPSKTQNELAEFNASALGMMKNRRMECEADHETAWIPPWNSTSGRLNIAQENSSEMEPGVKSCYKLWSINSCLSYFFGSTRIDKPNFEITREAEAAASIVDGVGLIPAHLAKSQLKEADAWLTPAKPST